MKKLLRHGRSNKSSGGGGGDEYTWIKLNALKVSSNGRLIPIYAIGHKTNYSYSSKYLNGIGFSSTIHTSTPSNIRDTSRIYISNDSTSYLMKFSYHKDNISYLSGNVRITSSENIVIRGSNDGSNVDSVYTYYNSDATKCFAEDMYEAGGVIYFSGAQANAVIFNWYVMIKTSDYGLL